MARISIAEAVRQFDVSRSTVLRRIKTGQLTRHPDGMIDTADLVLFFKLRSSDDNTDTSPDISPDTSPDILRHADDTPTDTSHQQQVIDILQKQLDDAQQEKERLMMLLAQEQQNVQRLLSVGRPAARRGFRDKIRQWWEGTQQTPEG